MKSRERFPAAQLEEIKSRTPLSSVFSDMGGIRFKGHGPVKWALSPWSAEKTASFKVDDQRQFFYCFSTGNNGDVFDAVMLLKGCKFVEAVEILGGVRDLSQEEQNAIQHRQAVLRAQDLRVAARDRKSVQKLIAACAPIIGTKADTYLAGRSINLTKAMSLDLHYAASLPYRGYADRQARDTVELGAFPAMVASIRDCEGEIIGAHRTYLDPNGPGKLSPPGDQNRNRAKKILGEAKGGMIWLSPRHKCDGRLLLAEGIETALSAAMFFKIDPGHAIGSAVSLGNLTGSSMGTIPHPDNPKKLLPAAAPDHDRPGIILPDGIEEVTLCLDGDSEPYNTWARLRVAERRFSELEIRVRIAVAPTGKDFNDVVMNGHAL